MNFIDISWKQFKDQVEKQILIDKKYIYRGQSNSIWNLKTTLHRTEQFKTPEDIEFYFDHIIPYAHETVATWEGRARNLNNNLELAQFVAYLRHNGFPTPLLDWTYSPFIAAFFAFDEINHYSPQNDYVCIYCFDLANWVKTFKQSYDYRDKNTHVSALQPSSIGNPKQLLQQGVFLYTNLENIESHIEVNEKKFSQKFLYKYRISCTERPQVMRELGLMNITPIQLFPSLESVCKKVATDVSLLFPRGKTKSEINTKNMIYELLKLRNTKK
ncbi:MAG: FRG domain-containing protein [Candidatus Gorgyraea atricola]|nr:FRG domain-containing protein [Candidatus Gorgyraea atricola]